MGTVEITVQDMDSIAWLLQDMSVILPSTRKKEEAACSGGRIEHSEKFL